MRSTRWALAALLAVLVATAHSQPQRYPPQGGTPVKYKSLQADAADLSIDAMLYKPAGTAKGAVVITHGAAGWADYREGQYARALSSAGYAVLAIDSYGPRGIVNMNTPEEIAMISPYAEARDAFAARRYLVSIGYQAERMAVMGSGRGGTIALLASDRTFVQDEKERFAAVIAISAACVFHPKTPKPASRVFIAIGEKNDVVGVQPCKEFAKEYAGAGGRVDVKLYPGAAEAFDGSPDNLRMFRDPFSTIVVDCNVSVESDGRSTYNGKTFAESDFIALATEMRKSCIKRGGFSWTNLTQKAAVTFDLIEFLDGNFRR
jgi:dienelactone hydrolase